MKFSAITLADKIKTLAGTVLVVLLAAQTIDLGTTGNAIIGGLAAVLLALGVKPLGPASMPSLATAWSLSRDPCERRDCSSCLLHRSDLLDKNLRLDQVPDVKSVPVSSRPSLGKAELAANLRHKRPRDADFAFSASLDDLIVRRLLS